MPVEEFYNRAREAIGGREVPRSCSTCQFNQDGLCAGYGSRTDNDKDTFGMSIGDAERMFPSGCDYWDVSLDVLIGGGF